ncbi:MAG: hypothetical protein WBF06_04575 [Candidatus Acidiferrales bacterium]
MDSIRRTLVRALIALMTLFGLDLALTNGQVRADQGSCEQIRAACKNAGFVQGGGARNGILLACYQPIVQGTPQPKMASIALPKIDPQVVSACRGGQSSSAAAPAPASAPLVPAADGQTVYDPSLNVTWLADGNLAGKQTFGVSNVNKSGSMDYATAVRWVAAMNALDNGAGYLGHNNWQLPTAPSKDASCAKTGRNGESFGFNCSESALGSLYYASLGLREPNTGVPMPPTTAGPFKDFQPYLYWSESAAADPKQGFVSFSFNSGFQGANVTLNYLYVLPMIKGKLPGTPPAAGQGLEVNPGGETVYDPISQVTWLADANLAAKQTFGVAGINPDGSMEHATALQWTAAMNSADQGRGYLGQTNWEMPETGPPDPTCSMKGTTAYGCTGSLMGELFYKQLGLHRGEPVVAVPDVKVGAFHNIQPYLYWACAAETAASPCQTDGPAEGFEWNFSFGNGFQGTNLLGNDLYVMVYYPGSPSK